MKPRSGHFIERQRPTLADLAIPIVDGVHQRTNDHPSETWMIFQGLEVEIDEYVGGAGGQVVGRRVTRNECSIVLVAQPIGFFGG